MKWHSIWVVWLLLSTGVSSCGASGNQSEDFLRKPMIERRTAILKYAPEDQVELFLNAMLVKHPPDLALADAIASNGQKIVPHLLLRLAEENRDVAKMHIIDVFRRMQELGYYSVVDDAQTMKTLEEQAMGVRDTHWRKISINMVARIRKIGVERNVD